VSVSIQLQAVKGRFMVFLEVGWFFSVFLLERLVEAWNLRVIQYSTK